MFDLEPTITLPWLRRLRWASAAGQLAVWLAVRVVLGRHIPVWPFVLATGVTAVSNLAIDRARSRWAPSTVMGTLLLLDIIVLTIELAVLGGATNPFTVMYLVYITLSAVVLSARWTTAISSLAILGFALLFAVPTEMHVHHSGRPIFDPHLQGMWAAFVVAAALMAFFVRRISRAIAVQRDQIAALREASARNARLASLATLAAGAAHELNNPLSTIAVAAHEATLHAARLVEGAAVSRDLELILEQVDRCQRILHQMAARVSSESTDGAIRTEELVGEVRRELGDRASRVELRLADAPAELAVPAAGAVQSLVALLKNALDASGPDDPIALELRGEADTIAIEILDRGAGIPPQLLDKVGEPFFTTKPPGRGLGLGVFLARVFFESLGGALAIEPRPGRGTRAVARFPRGLS